MTDHSFAEQGNGTATNPSVTWTPWFSAYSHDGDVGQSNRRKPRSLAARDDAFHPQVGVVRGGSPSPSPATTTRISRAGSLSVAATSATGHATGSSRTCRIGPGGGSQAHGARMPRVRLQQSEPYLASAREATGGPREAVDRDLADCRDRRRVQQEVDGLAPVNVAPHEHAASSRRRRAARAPALRPWAGEERAAPSTSASAGGRGLRAPRCVLVRASDRPTRPAARWNTTRGARASSMSGVAFGRPRTWSAAQRPCSLPALGQARGRRRRRSRTAMAGPRPGAWLVSLVVEAHAELAAEADVVVRGSCSRGRRAARYRRTARGRPRARPAHVHLLPRRASRRAWPVSSHANSSSRKRQGRFPLDERHIAAQSFLCLGELHPDMVPPPSRITGGRPEMALEAAPLRGSFLIRSGLSAIRRDPRRSRGCGRTTAREEMQHVVAHDDAPLAVQARLARGAPRHALALECSRHLLGVVEVVDVVVAVAQHGGDVERPGDGLGGAWRLRPASVEGRPARSSDLVSGRTRRSWSIRRRRGAPRAISPPAAPPRRACPTSPAGPAPRHDHVAVQVRSMARHATPSTTPRRASRSARACSRAQPSAGN